VVYRVSGNQPVTRAQLAQGDKNGITGRTKIKVFLLKELKAGTGQLPLQALGAGGGFPQQENPGAGKLFR
jgi:hypothetical protein